jgi:3-hydroxymyristoyl/3-hydroxydecanoyl-(acyl carrier protein) dehydratase
MRFLAPVFPGDRLEINVNILKIAGDITLVEGEVAVDATVVARGQLGFAKRALDPGLARRDSKPVTPAGS